MSDNFNRFSNFPRNGVLITNADADLVRPMFIRCNVAGTAVVTPATTGGTAPTAITVTMAVGEVLPCLVIRVAAASGGTFHGFW